MTSTTSDTSNLLICTACGTQFSSSSRTELTNCHICDDPRQFVPPTGQAFTTLSELNSCPLNYKNAWKQLDASDDRFWEIRTEPPFAIGQRAILIRTSHGNILWDCITLLTPSTTTWINSLGGLAAIVISHPHYYTTHLEWATAFSCPVYLASEDQSWISRHGPSQVFLSPTSTETNIEIAGQKTGILAIKTGGHFPGSLVLLAYNRLLIADTIVTTPSGKGDWSLGPAGGPDARPQGMNTFVFMWSIPNMIPLPPDEVRRMWEVLREYEFSSTHGAFAGSDVRDGGGGSAKSVKGRLLDSMQIQTKAEGWWEHELLMESCA